MTDASTVSQTEIGRWLARAGSASLRASIVPGKMRHVRSRKHLARGGQTLTQVVHPATTHFYLPSRDVSKAFCIKAFDVSQPGHQDFFRREVSMLRKLARFTGNESSPIAPRVLLSDATAGLVVMEWVDGRSVKSELLLGNLLQKEVSGLLRECGNWLRQFHHANGIMIAPAPAEQMLQDIERHLEDLDLAGHGHMLDCPLFSTGLAWLRQKAAAVDGTPVEWSVRHHDFTPSNLMRNGNTGSLLGIDFGYSHERGPVATDLAWFMLRTSNLTVLRLNARSVARRIVAAVAGGYNTDSTALELEWINWCVVHASLLRMMQAASAYSAGRQGIAAGFRRFLRSHMVNRAARHIVPAVVEADHQPGGTRWIAGVASLIVVGLEDLGVPLQLALVA